MWTPYDYKEIGQIDEALMAPVKDLLEKNNWTGKEYDRYEPTLLGGKLVAFPWIIVQPHQLRYTPVQKTLLDAVAPIVDEVMKLFPGYVKVRGELATLLPGVKVKLHYDDRWFHENCRRIHVPIVTNEDCQQIFEDRSFRLEYSKIYEINNRILHSAANNGNAHRVHLILDLLDETLYNSINRSKDKMLEISTPAAFKKR